ncbi:hypothetical protein [Burkholderia gladioli]|uniref:hypothetical protein n=1 Tax=Burkholderia gladioli TaxID=28095 RepID=UPI002FE0198F
MALRVVDTGTNPIRYEDDYRGALIEISVAYNIQTDGFGFHVYVIARDNSGRPGLRTKVGGMYEASSMADAQTRGVELGRRAIDARTES